MIKKDYYEILGIDKKSNLEEIKKAYREKAKEHHPDRNIGDALSASKFQEVQEAFEVLSDPRKRSIYDMSGMNMHWHQNGNWHDNYSESNFSQDPFNQFSSFFSKSRFKGRTIIYKLEISLQDSFYGCSSKIAVEKNKICDACNGSGAEELIDCAACFGKGILSQKQGNFVVNLECSNCQGKGKIVKTTCSLCMGHGMSSKEIKEYDIKIPKGASTGFQIVLHKEGEPSKHIHGMNGDLVVNVVIKEHSYFKRDGLNLILEMPVSYGQLMRGDTVTIPYFNKQTLLLKIPPHTENTAKLRLNGLGFVLPNGAVGDYLIQLKCDIPKKTTDEYNNLIDQLFSLEKKYPSDRIKRWKEKVFSEVD